MSGRELPSTWVWTNFDQVASVASDLVDPTLTPNTPHVAPNHVSSWTGELIEQSTIARDEVTSAKHRFRAGQIVYSKIRPYLAKAIIAEFDGLCSADMYPIDARINNRYLLRWMLSQEFTEMASRSQGRTVLPKINQDALQRLTVPVAPLPEQRRIVEKIEALTARSRRAREALDALPALIDRYRQSILAAAFRGDLTAKDKGNDRRDLEPGEGPHPIPQEWKWLAMQDIVSTGPQNGLYLPKNKYGTGHPILRIDNFQDYSSDAAADFKKVDLSNLEREVYGLSVGDIVINRVNAPSHLGKCMVVSERHVRAVFESNMMRLRVKDNVPARYVAYFLKSPAGRKALLRNAKWAVNQASINQGDVLATPIPLPTELGEMQQIVDQIESALAMIEAFGTGVESTSARLSTLDQSILAKAFRGELVPQDPNDEPASVLLERIRAERAAAGEKPRRGRPRKAG